MAETNLIDPQAFDNLFASIGDDPDFMNELLDTYFADAPQLIATLRAALAANNTVEFRRAAHSLKSNSANFGARGLAAMCKQLEDMGRDGILDGAASRITAVEDEYAQVKLALEQKRR